MVLSVRRMEIQYRCARDIQPVALPIREERKEPGAMTRSELRAALPQVTAFGDDMRKYFPELVIRHYRENGIEFGKPGPVGVIPVIKK